MDFRTIAGRSVLFLGCASLIGYDRISREFFAWSLLLYVVIRTTDALARESRYVPPSTPTHRIVNVFVDWLWNGFRGKSRN